MITITDIREGCKVRIGIDAPKDITINREEIEVEIEAEKRRAARQEGRAGR